MKPSAPDGRDNYGRQDIRHHEHRDHEAAPGDFAIDEKRQRQAEPDFAGGVRAPRTYEIPVEVVTEAIVNAVAHRDYTDNGSVQVMLFADRLEVRNPGRLPPPLTLEKLREAHRSVPGNPLLAESMYLAEYIERMGTGTLDMIRRCVEAGLPEPGFAVTDGFVTTVWRATLPWVGRVAERVTGQAYGRPEPSGMYEQAGVQARVQERVQREQGEGQAGGHGGQSGVQAGVHVGVHAGLGDREVAMLRACVRENATSKELQNVAGYAGRTRSFELWLNRLLSEGLLEMTVPDKPRSPVQKYRLTDRGRAAIAPAGKEV